MNWYIFRTISFRSTSSDPIIARIFITFIGVGNDGGGPGLGNVQLDSVGHD